MYKEFGIMVQTDKIKEGDIACHINNWNAGIPFFAKVSKEDEEMQHGIYIKLVQTSIE